MDSWLPSRNERAIKTIEFSQGTYSEEDENVYLVKKKVLFHHDNTSLTSSARIKVDVATTPPILSGSGNVLFVFITKFEEMKNLLCGVADQKYSFHILPSSSL